MYMAVVKVPFTHVAVSFLHCISLYSYADSANEECADARSEHILYSIASHDCVKEFSIQCHADSAYEEYADTYH